MATYIYTGDDSDLAPSWANTTLFDYDMFTGATGGGSSNDSIPGSSTRSASFITLVDVPNSDAWESGGTQTIRLDVSMGDADFTGKCRVVRLSSTGTILQSGAFTGTQVINADRTFTPVAPTWTGGEEACGNRYAIEWEFVNADSMAHALKLNIRVTTADIVTDITEDGGTCGVTEVDKTFTTDAILKKSDNDKTFTTDAILKQSNIEKTLTADAILVNVRTKDFTVDAILVSTVDKDFTVDAILVNVIEKTFTVDAILVSTVEKTFTVDSILKATTDKDFTVDAILKQSNIDKTFTTDAILVSTVEKTFTVDAILKATTDKSFTTDAILKQSDIDKNFTVDALLREVFEKTFTTDALLQAVDIDKSFTTDALLQNQDIDKTFTVDALLRAVQTKTFTTDALLQVIDNDKTFTTDAILKKSDIEKTFTVDAILDAGATEVDKTFTVDAILQATFTKAFTVDAILTSGLDVGESRRITRRPFPRVKKEFEFNIKAGLGVVNFEEIRIIALLMRQVKKSLTLPIFISIIKEIKKEIGVKAILDHTKLKRILDET